MSAAGACLADDVPEVWQVRPLGHGVHLRGLRCGMSAAGSLLLAYLGSLLLKVPVLGIFLPPGSPVYRLASEGFPLYALSRDH